LIFSALAVILATVATVIAYSKLQSLIVSTVASAVSFLFYHEAGESTSTLRNLGIHGD
jgi:hypothetical protein